MNVFEKAWQSASFAARIKAYEAQVRCYAAKVEAFRLNYVGKTSKQENANMSDARKEVFSVYTASNGYYAEMPDGSIVVGTTLSDVCEAAQAAVATTALSGDTNDGLAPITMSNPLGQWQKVR